MDVFNEIFDHDNYTPIYVEDEDDYIAVIVQFPLDDDDFEQVILSVISFISRGL